MTNESTETCPICKSNMAIKKVERTDDNDHVYAVDTFLYCINPQCVLHIIPLLKEEKANE